MPRFSKVGLVMLALLSLAFAGGYYAGGNGRRPERHYLVRDDCAEGRVKALEAAHRCFDTTSDIAQLRRCVMGSL